MKNIAYLKLLLAVIALATFTAQADVVINETNFPDEDFRYYVKNEHFYFINGVAVYPGADDVLTAAELATYKDMNVAYNHNNIASLQGIEFFTNLNVLNCNTNKLTSVNLSNNKQLEWLIIYRNQLTSLDMTSNTRLKYLRCWQNTTMTSLNVAGLTQLIELDCNGCNLSTLNISGCTGLQLLKVYGNNLQGTGAADFLSSLPTVTDGKLYYGYENASHDNKPLTSEDLALIRAKGWTPYYYSLSADDFVEYPVAVPLTATYFPDAKFRTAITQYDTDGDGILSHEELNAVTTLSLNQKSIQNLQGIEYFTELKQLFCNDNQLTSLDVSKNTKLQLLDCFNNRITTLDVSNHESLFRVFCNNNRLENLVINNCPNLSQLYIYRNRIPFRKMVDLFDALPETSETTYFRMYDNSNLSEGNKMYDCQALRNAIDRGWTPEQYLNGDWVPFYGITDYSIIVGGVQITEANMDNITGADITGSVTYNPYENVLTLTNATITSADCIRTGSTVHGLKILISGEVNLTATQHGRPAIIFNNLDGDVIQGISDGDQYAKLNINVPGGNYVTPAIYYISGYGTRCYIKDIDIHMTGNAYIGSENWDEKLTVENSTIISEAPHGEFYVIDDVQLDGCYVALPEGGYFDRGQLCNAQGQTHYGPYQILRTQAEPVVGDVNGDDVCNSADVTALYQFILNNDASKVVNGDQNGDGTINSADVTAVYKIILGSEN
jgi:hypothetical protein